MMPSNTIVFIITGSLTLSLVTYFLVRHLSRKKFEAYIAREKHYQSLIKEKSQLLKNEQEARSQAEKAILDRDEFLSIASHELKTPLTTVILQLQATLRKILTQSLADFSGKDLLDSLRIVEKQSQTLSTLIKDLLNVSIASTGRLTLNPEKVNLSDLTTALVSKYSHEIEISGAKLTLDIQHPEVIGSWDTVRLEQALTNLLTNALKYAPNQKITITIKKDHRFGYFQIEDTGPGISQQHQKTIFQPFKRAGNTNARGLGVGLFITHQIALAHNGEISVKSKSGKGTTFILKLPLSS